MNDINRSLDRIDLSISVVNTSNWNFLEPCLGSIYENIKDITFEVLVVDNASEDGSAEKIRANFPDVIVSVNQQRYGFAKNNNINLRKASGRYLMLLNDDTLVLPNSIEKVIKFLDRNRKVGVVGCKMIWPDGKYQATSARKFRTIISEFLIETGLHRNVYYVTSIPKDPNADSIEIDCPSEAGMIVKKEVIDQVGLLDEQFFMFGEGPDWCRRIKKAGWKVVYFPFSPIIHFGGVTNKRSSLKMYLQSYKSTYLFFRKESHLKSLIFRILLLSLFLFKHVFTTLILSFADEGLKKEKRESINYYKNMLHFLLFKINDADYPYPIN